MTAVVAADEVASMNESERVPASTWNRLSVRIEDVILNEMYLNRTVLVSVADMSNRGPVRDSLTSFVTCSPEMLLSNVS